jgi:hypothetical protein
VALPAKSAQSPALPGPHDERAALAAGQASFNTAIPAAQPVRVQAAGASGSGGQFVTYRVFATRYDPNTPGSVEVAVPDKCVKFAALGQSTTGCPPGYFPGLDYRVIVTRDNGASMAIPVKDTGPWNIDDNYWDLPNGTRPRRLFQDLPRGLPESQAAHDNGYNTVPNCKNLDQTPSGHAGGADQFGRCVLNDSAVDISTAAAQQLGFSGAEFVTATFLWEPGNALAKPSLFRNGTWFFRNTLSSGGGDFSFIFGQPGDIGVLGDWNNDGVKTVGVFRPSNGTWYLRNSNSPGPPDGVFRYGSPGDVPVVGDWNNDGTDTIGVFRGGTWFLTNHFNSGSAEGVFHYGNPGDVPVTGDWNQDGTDTIGVFRGGTWFLTNHFNSGGAEGVFTYGSPGDVPVTGDWDGDHTDTLGVFRNGTWYVSNLFGSSVGQQVFNFGLRGDQALSWR